MNSLKLLSIGEVSELISRSKSSIYADIKKGVFPPPVKIGTRISRWREDAVNEWITALPLSDLGSTSESIE